MKKRKTQKPTKVTNPDGSTTTYYSDGSSITTGKAPPEWNGCDNGNIWVDLNDSKEWSTE